MPRFSVVFRQAQKIDLSRLVQNSSEGECRKGLTEKMGSVPFFLIMFVSEKELMKEIWFRTDEIEDLITSMSMFAESCSRIIKDETFWKWAIISLHNALQATMVVYLRGSNDLRITRKKDAEAWMKAHETGDTYPETKMDNFLNLYGKLTKEQRDGYKFGSSNQQDASVTNLNYFRNEFIHFMSMGLSINVYGMPAVCKDCLDIIDELKEHFLCIRWIDDDQKNRFDEQLKQARENMGKIELEYLQRRHYSHADCR